MRHVILGLIGLGLFAAGVAYESRGASGTDVPAIELRTVEEDERTPKARSGAPQKREETGGAKGGAGAEKRSGGSGGASGAGSGGADPVPAPVPAPAGGDDDDDDVRDDDGRDDDGGDDDGNDGGGDD